MAKDPRPTAIDLFCGARGLSEGFRLCLREDLDKLLDKANQESR